MSDGKETTPLRWLWLAVPLVAVAELGAQWYIPRQDPSPEDWKRAAESIAGEKQKHDLVVVAPDWAVHGRVELGGLIPLEDLCRFDTTRYDRLFEVSLREARAPESEGLEPESEVHFGRLAVRRYDLPPRAEVLYDFVENAPDAEVEHMPRARGRAIVDHWFRPRLVIPVPLERRAAMTFRDVPLEGVLRGWAIVGRLDYRAHRLPSGGPIHIEVSAQGEPLGEVEIHNFGPLEPFEIPLPGKGRGAVRFEIWTADGRDRPFGLAADVRRPPEADR